MNIHQDVWAIVTTVLSAYSDIKPSPSSLFPTVPIKTLFPSENPMDMEDKQAFLFSNALCEILDNINELYSLELKFDFLIRQEWELFETIGHVYMYFIYSIENERS